MIAARAAAVALIAFSGVAVPASGAAHADGDDPLLCGLLPCDGSSEDDTGDDPATTPIDADLDLDLDPGVELFGDDGTLIDADADVPTAAVQVNTLDHSVDGNAAAVLASDAIIGHGVVATAQGAADGQAGVNGGGGRTLLTADTANHFCGVQIVVAAESSSTCEPNASPAATRDEGLMAVAESVDLCGAHLVVAGSATTDCGQSPSVGSPAAGSSWTLANAAAIGTVCGLSIAVAGESDTTCPGTAQEAPVSDVQSQGSGAGTSGTGASGVTAGAGGLASSPATGGQPSQASEADQPSEVGDSSGSGSSLPVTGASVLVLIALAIGFVATGSIARGSSWTRTRHQV